jgi:Ca2+-binding RTX toxin-like protein
MDEVGRSNIQNVRAGSGGSTLTGNAQGNILVGGAGVDNIQGGSGRSVLIGGGGADHVKGGSGDDLVLGGTTNYDANDAALLSVLAEWQSGNSYAVRISHLKNGGGLNGSNKLVFGTTVHDDEAANILTGGAGMDWFFKGAHDTITDRQSGEQVN